MIHPNRGFWAPTFCVNFLAPPKFSLPQGQDLKLFNTNYKMGFHSPYHTAGYIPRICLFIPFQENCTRTFSKLPPFQDFIVVKSLSDRSTEFCDLHQSTSGVSFREKWFANSLNRNLGHREHLLVIKSGF